MLQAIVLFGQIKMLNKKNFIFILEKLFQQSKVCYDEFNSADGKIGDGAHQETSEYISYPKRSLLGPRKGT